MSFQMTISIGNLVENSLLRLSINRISWGSEALYAWLEIHGWLTNCLGSLWHNMVIAWLVQSRSLFDMSINVFVDLVSKVMTWLLDNVRWHNGQCLCLASLNSRTFWELRQQSSQLKIVEGNMQRVLGSLNNLQGYRYQKVGCNREKVLPKCSPDALIAACTDVH